MVHRPVGARRRSPSLAADPAAPRSLAAIVELTGAIATSGTCERGSHLADPHAGRPGRLRQRERPSGGLADALATALAVAGEGGLHLIGSLEGYQAPVIGFNGSRRWTRRFPFAGRQGAASPR